MKNDLDFLTVAYLLIFLMSVTEVLSLIFLCGENKVSNCLYGKQQCSLLYQPDFGFISQFPTTAFTSYKS